LRTVAGKWVLKTLSRDKSLGDDRDKLLKAFSHNVNAWWSFLSSTKPRGWTWRRARRMEQILADADHLVQSLNDQYASPSGKQGNGKS